MGESDGLPELIHAGYCYALSLTHHKEDAEDLVHDAWLAVIRADGPQNKSYFFRAIRSRWINENKRRKIVPMLSYDAAEMDRASDSLKQVTSETDYFELSLLERSLSRLRPIEREALYCTAVAGFTAQEISELTCQPRGTVLSLIHRARNKIRDYFFHHQKEIKR